ncbi:MAG: hypothetical protein H5U10_15740 [Desulfacinum sp.]|jgi:hypothetical protein|nr:hypothetical protein [Desulfacinum sp.]MBZ4658990.1 hypothetical protein [Desulfacinum sp.]
MQMDRAIFQLKAGVEATSLYILICALVDEGKAATLENVRNQWTGSDEALSAGLEELIRLGVLSPAPPDGQTPLKVRPTESWNWKE